MDKEQSNDLLQENSKNDPIYRESSDNFNLTGLSKNQAIPYIGLEKYQSIVNSSQNFQPEKSNYIPTSMLFSMLEENNSAGNNIFNLFKPSDCSNNIFSHNQVQIASSIQDLNFNSNVNSINNNTNGSTMINLNLLGSSFPLSNNNSSSKTNQKPLQNLNFEINGVNSFNNNNTSNNSNSNNNSSNSNNNNNNNNSNVNNIFRPLFNNPSLNNNPNINNNNNSSSIIDSNGNSNNSNKSIGNGMVKGISSNNSNFNFSLQNISKPYISNDQFAFNHFIPSGFNPYQPVLSNDGQQNKESLTKISSSSSSSRTHSTKRGTTIIIHAQQNNSPPIINKQGSDSNQQDSKQDQSKLFYEQALAGKLFGFGGKENTNFNQQNNFLLQTTNNKNNNNNNNQQPKMEDNTKQEDQEESAPQQDKKGKKPRISKKQNLQGEEKEPSKKRKLEQKPGDHNFSDETQGLNYDDNVKSLKNDIKLEEEKKDKYNIKKEQMEEENDQSEISEIKPAKNNDKQKNGDGQEKKSSSRQSQHKNVYKNFGKELLRFVRSRQQHCEELKQEEYSFLLEQLTGGLNDKDTKQTLPIQKKEKLQLLWTLKVEQNPPTSSGNKKSKNDQHNKNSDDDKNSEYYFITEKEDEIAASDSIEIKTKKYFRKISWEFFNEWAFQYVMSSRKLDKKEIHLKCIPSFLYGIMCPKSLEVFKPIREHDKSIQPTQNKQSTNSNNNLS